MVTMQANFLRVVVKDAGMTDQQRRERDGQFVRAIERARAAGQTEDAAKLEERMREEGPYELLCIVRALLKKIKQRVLVVRGEWNHRPPRSRTHPRPDGDAEHGERTRKQPRVPKTCSDDTTPPSPVPHHDLDAEGYASDRDAVLPFPLPPLHSPLPSVANSTLLSSPRQRL